MSTITSESHFALRLDFSLASIHPAPRINAYLQMTRSFHLNTRPFYRASNKSLSQDQRPEAVRTTADDFPEQHRLDTGLRPSRTKVEIITFIQRSGY
jgi:hypothetical protein